MPLYEYKCDNCGDVFEVMQKFSDETLTTHVKCGGKVERLISTSAFQFKGSGWYVNDYAKKSSPSSDASSSSSKDAPANASTKVETTAKSDSGTSSNGTATPAATNSGSGSDSKSKS